MKASENKKISNPPSVRKEGFLPFLLAAVCMLITLLTIIIDRFIYPFGSDMLSPAIGQIVILLIPTYLGIMFLSPEKKPVEQLKSIGIGRLHAKYVFFMIFAAMFAITGALILNMVFGGVHSDAKGFTLLAAFTAGANEYTVHYPYLIIVYVLIPAILEEIVFRGFVFSELKKISLPLAIVLSSLLSALFAFSFGGIPAALFCALTYCFILMTTKSLQACMIVHLIYNLYALFWGSNISAYFLSAPNRALLVIIVITAWLISASLFFTESARVYRAKADEVHAGAARSELPKLHIKALWQEIIGMLCFKPTIICAIVCIALYVAIMVINILS